LFLSDPIVVAVSVCGADGFTMGSPVGLDSSLPPHAINTLATAILVVIHLRGECVIANSFLDSS